MMKTNFKLKLMAASLVTLSIMNLEVSAASDGEKKLAAGMKAKESASFGDVLEGEKDFGDMSTGKKTAAIVGLGAIGGGAAGYRLATSVLGEGFIGKTVGSVTGLGGVVIGTTVGAAGSLFYYGPKAAVSGLAHGFKKLGCKTGCAVKDVNAQVASFDSASPDGDLVGKMAHCLSKCQLTDTKNYTCAVLQYKFSSPDKVVDMAKLLNEGPTNSKRASTKLEKMFVDDEFPRTCLASISDTEKQENFKQNYAAMSFAGRIFMAIRLKTMAKSQVESNAKLAALTKPGVLEQGIKKIFSVETEGASDADGASPEAASPAAS